MPRNTILYAENHDYSRNLFIEILKEEFSDYNIESFPDGIQLKNRLEEDVNNIALVITDNDMPGPHGFELIKNYAKRKSLDRVPFILLYGGDERIGKEAVKQGAFGYVLKLEGDPRDNLTKTIKKALNQ